MGSGEYNNLGHYMVKYDDGTTTKIKPCVMHDLNIGSLIMTEKSQPLTRNTHGIMNCGVTIEVKFSKKAIKTLKRVFAKHFPTNNFLKMHGLPMRRKVRR